MAQIWQTSVIANGEFGQIEYVSCTLDRLGTAFVSYYNDWPNNFGKNAESGRPGRAWAWCPIRISWQALT